MKARGKSRISGLPNAGKRAHSLHLLVVFWVCVAAPAMARAASEDESSFLQSLLMGSTTTHYEYLEKLQEDYSRGRFVSSLEKALRASDPEQRARAAAALGVMKDLPASSVKRLIRATEDSHWRVRQQAAIALGSVGTTNPRAIPALVSVMHDRDPGAGYGAVVGLSRIGSAALPALTSLLLGSEPEARLRALEAISRLGDRAREAGPILTRTLAEGEEAERYAAAAALVHVGVPVEALPGLMRALQQATTAVLPSSAAIQQAWPVEALGILGASATVAIPLLTRALRENGNWEMRARAAEALGKIGSASSVAQPELLNALRDPVPYVRAGAVRALQNIGSLPSQAVPELLSLLDDEYWVVSEGAVKLLKMSGPEGVRACFRSLVGLLESQDSRVRNLAIINLGDLGAAPRDALPVLVRALRDPDEGVRRAAINAVGAMGTQSQIAVPPLLEILEGPTPSMHSQAAQALSKIIPTSRDAVGPLVRALGHHDASVVSFAADTLVEVLASETKVSDLAVDKLATASTTTIPALVRAGGARRWRGRDVPGGLIRALERIGGPEAEAAVQSFRENRMKH